jgi:hypothetical protein
MYSRVLPHDADSSGSCLGLTARIGRSLRIGLVEDSPYVARDRRLFVDVESDVLDRKCFGGMLVHSRSLSRVALVGALGASAIYATRLGSALVRRLTPPAGGPPFHIV